MKEIYLTNGQTAQVDDEDFEHVSQFEWRAQRGGNTFYAVGSIDGKAILLHRLLMNAPDGIEVDHIHGNGLNCTRENMRLATHAQNMKNRAKQKNGLTSIYKGVHFKRSHGRWSAELQIDGKCKFLGYFDDEIDAAHAYDDAARIYYGEFARPNAAAAGGLERRQRRPRFRNPRTHCKNGHAFSPENTILHADNGGRRCRICRRNSNRVAQRACRARAAARDGLEPSAIQRAER